MATEWTYKLAPAQLTALWSVGSGRRVSEAGEVVDLPIEELLSEVLESSVSSLGDVSALSDDDMGRDTGDDSPRGVGKSVERVLLDEQAPVALLKWLSTWGKDRMLHAATAARRDVGGAVYYAAIASATVHHRRKLSKLDDRTVAKNLATLALAPWIPTTLKELYARARTLYRRTSGTDSLQGRSVGSV